LIYYTNLTISLSISYTYCEMNKVYAVEIDPTLFPPAQHFATISDLINLLLPNLMIAAGVIFLALALIFGFGIIKSAGSGDAQSLEKGSKALTFAILGFVLIFSSFFIIQLIETITGINILKPGV